MRYLLVFLALVCCAVFTGCGSPKSSSRIYEGDGPNIRFEESHAGGPVGTR